MYSGKFIVKWARRFLPFSPTLNAPVKPQTGGLARNSWLRLPFESTFSCRNLLTKCPSMSRLFCCLYISHTEVECLLTNCSTATNILRSHLIVSQFITIIWPVKCLFVRSFGPQQASTCSMLAHCCLPPGHVNLCLEMDIHFFCAVFSDFMLDKLFPLTDSLSMTIIAWTCGPKVAGSFRMFKS